MMIQLTPEDRRAINMELSKRSLAEFAKQAWHVLEPTTELKWGWALDAICEHLEAVTAGEIKRLIINVPPGCMKSMLTAVMWPAWEWGPKGLPHHRFMSTAFRTPLAIRDNLKCSRLIKSRWYRDQWPIGFLVDQSAKLENTRTGFREAMSFAGMTGSRGDRVIVDDPLSTTQANSDAELVAAETTFLEGLPSRVNNEDSAIVMIMQRLHAKDPTGIALAKDLGYEHLMLPMEFEPERRCVTSIGFKDPRKKAGELLFPERFPAQDVADLKKSLGSYGTAGQLQQRPSPRGGGLLRDEWFKTTPSIPDLEWRAIYVDTAQKEEQRHDYSVFEVYGKVMGRKQLVLIDVLRDKWGAPALLKHARAFWTKHKEAMPHVPLRYMAIEDKSSGTGLIQQLKRGDHDYDPIPVKAIPRTRDKVSRAQDVAPLLENGCFLMLGNQSWNSDFMSECSAFPAGAHDDQVDPMMDAVTDMIYAGGTRARMRTL